MSVECGGVPTANTEAWQLLRDIRDGKVNPEDEAEKFLRAYPVWPDAPNGEVVAWDQRPNVEDLLLVCVPGGQSCDPQMVADNIRRYFDSLPSPALPVAQAMRLTDAQWTNIVNYGRAWEGYEKAEAVEKAVEMTVAKLNEIYAAPALSEGLTELVVIAGLEKWVLLFEELSKRDRADLRVINQHDAGILARNLKDAVAAARRLSSPATLEGGKT